MVAKKGKQIDQLFLGLGLDVSQLDADFVSADKTVQEEMNKLSRTAQSVKLKTAIEVTGLSETGNQSEALTAKLKGLNESLHIQEQRVKLLSAEHMDYVNRLGEDAAGTQNLTNRLLREQKAQSELAAEIKRTTAALKEQEQANQAAATQANLSSLSAKSEHAKLETEIKVLGLDESTNGIEILKTKIAGLKSQMDIQKQTTAALSSEYKRVAVAEGESSLAAMRLKTNLLQAERAEAVLKSQLTATNMSLNQQTIAMNQTAISSGKLNFSSLKNGTQSAKGAIGSVAGALGTANAAMLAFVATAATLGGLTSFTDGAIEAGNAAYKLKSRLNLTATEAGSLNRMLGMADVDAKTFTNTMIRLDKSVQTAGKNGNTTTNALDRFGVSLKDGDGRLKNYSDQLVELAKGYEAASAAGMEEAYTAEILGNRGAELVPLLKEYNELATSSSKIKTIGIDTEEAHQAALHMKELNMQSSQLKNALGNALMPFTNEFAPKIQELLADTTEWIKEHKDGVKSIVNAIIFGVNLVTDTIGFGLKLLKTGVDVVVEPISECEMITNRIDAGLNNIRNTVDAIGKLFDPINEGMENISRNGLLGVQNAKAFHEQLEAEKRLAEMEKKRIVQAEKLKEEQAKQAQTRVEQLKKEEEQTKAVNKVKFDIAAEEYKRSHNDLENRLYDIEREKNEAIAAEQDIATATEIAELKRVAAINAYNEEVKKNNEELNNAIYSITHSALENRLADIEKERKAWIKKTQDEVKATQLSEAEKRKAINQAVVDAIKNRQDSIKALKKYQDAMKNISQTKMSIGGVDVSEDMIKQQANRAKQTLKDELQDITLKKLGLNKEDFEIPAQLAIDADNLQQSIDDNIYSIVNGNVSSIDGLLNNLNSSIKDSGMLAANDYFAPFREQAQLLTAQLASAGQMAVEGSRYQQQGGGSVNTDVNINIGGIAVTIKNDIDRAKVIEEAEQKVGRELKIILNEALSNL